MLQSTAPQPGEHWHAKEEPGRDWHVPEKIEGIYNTKTVDLLYMAGGGIMAHPLGATAGVKALQQAWDGAVKGASLEETAITHPGFAASVKKFGAL